MCYTTVDLYNKEVIMENYYVSIIRRCELYYIRGELENFGLMPLEGRLIRLLAGKNCSQECLGEILDIDKGRIAKTVSLLEEKNLICRNIDESNRRKKIVGLTKKGKEIYEEICRIYIRWDEICYRDFTEEEKVLNNDFVRRISENVIEHKKKSGGKLNG